MDPEIALDLQELNKSLKSENLSVRSRLLSIHHDVHFYNRVSTHFGKFETFANERCGLWYVPSSQTSNKVYFKSTDGHTNNWGFSIRRLNFQILNKCAIIVDSTRSGKLSPDSLSKTIPIWCCVLNKICSPSATYDEELFIDESCVSQLERKMILKSMSSIENQISPYLKENGPLSLSNLKQQGMVSKIKPYFVNPKTNLDSIKFEDGYQPLILLTVSEMVKDGSDKSRGFTYVQGAGDDHELWSNGLSPENFWSNQDQLNEKAIYNMTDKELENVIQTIVQNGNTPAIAESDSSVPWIEYKINSNLSFGSIKPGTTITDMNGFDSIIVLETSIGSTLNKVHVYDLESGNKKSGKLLRDHLPKIMTQVDDAKTLVLCSTGTDLSVGVCLCVMAYQEFSNGDCTVGKLSQVNKVSIRKDLIRMIELNDKVNPQRVTLNAVNSFLMR